MSEHVSVMWLPKLVEPRKLVSTGAAFDRQIRIDDMPRLEDLALSVEHVSVVLRFARDEQGRPEMLGTINTSLQLSCQRCLDAMPLVLELPVHLALVWDEAQAKALPKNIEPWIVGEEETDLCAILEEEILLSLPVVPKHEDDCQDPAYFGDTDALQEKQETYNPFSILEGLKKDS